MSTYDPNYNDPYVTASNNAAVTRKLEEDANQHAYTTSDRRDSLLAAKQAQLIDAQIAKNKALANESEARAELTRKKAARASPVAGKQPAAATSQPQPSPAAAPAPETMTDTDTNTSTSTGTFNMAKGAVAQGVKLAGAATINKAIVSALSQAALKAGVPRHVLDTEGAQVMLGFFGPMALHLLAEQFPQVVPKADIVKGGCELALTHATADTIAKVVQPLVEMLLPTLATIEAETIKVSAATGEKVVAGA